MAVDGAAITFKWVPPSATGNAVFAPVYFCFLFISSLPDKRGATTATQPAAVSQ